MSDSFNIQYRETDGVYVPIMSRTRPNIIITGTPGVGKTTHCEMLAEQLGLRHLGINEVIKDKECYVGRDEEMQSWVLDEESEDKVCAVLVPLCCVGESCMSLRRGDSMRDWDELNGMNWG